MAKKDQIDLINRIGGRFDSNSDRYGGISVFAVNFEVMIF
jgi:hypothetical protein